jgi:NADPH:quinone reductase-like Zn-dependent oxidoreductase
LRFVPINQLYAGISSREGTQSFQARIAASGASFIPAARRDAVLEGPREVARIASQQSRRGANIGPCIGALRRGGTLVGFGFMGAPGVLTQLAMFAHIFLGARLRGRRGTFYGITLLYRKNPQLLREDLPKIFALLAEKKIDPLVARTFPLLDARKALELLASGSVEGKIVLTDV